MYITIHTITTSLHSARTYLINLTFDFENGISFKGKDNGKTIKKASFTHHITDSCVCIG